jgi:hypothetical protein
VTSPDEEMSSSDRVLMKALAEAIGDQRPPIDLVARCEGLLSWIDVDSELASLLDQPVPEEVGTRGGASSAIAFEFAIADGTCVIEVTPSQSALHGQLLGGETAQVIVRTAAGETHSLPVDELGNFTIDNPPSGAIRLEWELIAGSRRIHTDWFVI